MSPSEKTLVVILRASAIILLTALIPTVMPFAWMKEVHVFFGYDQESEPEKHLSWYQGWREAQKHDYDESD